MQTDLAQTKISARSWLRIKASEEATTTTHEFRRLRQKTHQQLKKNLKSLQKHLVKMKLCCFFKFFFKGKNFRFVAILCSTFFRRFAATSAKIVKLIDFCCVFVLFSAAGAKILVF